MLLDKKLSIEEKRVLLERYLDYHIDDNGIIYDEEWERLSRFFEIETLADIVDHIKMDAYNRGKSAGIDNIQKQIKTALNL